MGFEFQIQYKDRKTNVPANTLSRKSHVELFSNVAIDFVDEVKKTWSTDEALVRIIADLQVDLVSHPKVSWLNGELRRSGRLMVGNNIKVKAKILKCLHNSPLGGH